MKSVCTGGNTALAGDYWTKWNGVGWLIARGVKAKEGQQRHVHEVGPEREGGEKWLHGLHDHCSSPSSRTSCKGPMGSDSNNRRRPQMWTWQKW